MWVSATRSEVWTKVRGGHWKADVAHRGDAVHLNYSDRNGKVRARVIYPAEGSSYAEIKE